MKTKILRWSTLFVAVTILTGVVLYTQQLIAEQMDNRQPSRPAMAQRPEVKVITVTGENHTAKIRGYGETRTHYSLTLAAQTNGEVTMLAANLEPGCRVVKGDLLVQLEDSDYRSDVATARSELATARLELLEEQREANQALSEWQASGLTGQPDSELVLHGPQLDAAKAAVEKAEAALLSAETRFNHTRIVAPFDAIVVERLTAPGSYLQTGTGVATLYSTDMIEIPVPLSNRDWANLPQQGTFTETHWPVQLTGVEGQSRWTGRVLRAEQHIDSASRQRTLIVVVDAPLDQKSPLLPGVFLEVDIDGKKVDNIWELPSSALSQQGEIWYVTEDNTLAKLPLTPLFSNGEAIYVKAPDEMAQVPTRVVIHPLSTYLAGMAIQPVLEGDNV